MPESENHLIHFASGPIEVVFERVEDRFQQRVNGPQFQLVATDSAEIDTPVFTEVHPQGDLLFLSGAVKDQLWSMSIERTKTGLLFDVACRMKTLPDQLGTVYQATGDIDPSIEGQPTKESEPPSVLTESGSIMILAKSENATLPATIRYRFAI